MPEDRQELQTNYESYMVTQCNTTNQIPVRKRGRLNGPSGAQRNHSSMNLVFSFKYFHKSLALTMVMAAISQTKPKN